MTKYYIPYGNYTMYSYRQTRSSQSSRYWKKPYDETKKIVDNNYISNIINGGNPFSSREWKHWNGHDGKVISYSPDGLSRWVWEFYYTLEKA